MQLLIDFFLKDFYCERQQQEVLSLRSEAYKTGRSLTDWLEAFGVQGSEVVCG